MLSNKEIKIPVLEEAIAPNPKKIAPFNPDELALIFSLIIKIFEDVVGQIIPVENPKRKNGKNIKITSLLKKKNGKSDKINPQKPITKL